MLESNPSQFTEEQSRTLRHFNERSDYWYDVYQEKSSYAGYTLQKQHHFILDWIHQIEGARQILDVGCGAGVAAITLAEQGYKVSGLDIAPNMIQRAQTEAQRYGVDCDFKVGIAEKLPYADSTFDVLIALGLLGNILDDSSVLKEMARVLKPGGRLLVTIPNMLAFDLWLAFPKSLPIILGATRFRQPLRKLGNLGRHLFGKPIKDVSKLRFNQCVIPSHYIRYLQLHGFSHMKYRALTFGPILPFGLHLFSNQVSIGVSEKLAHYAKTIKGLNRAGTIIVYEGQRL